MYINIHHSRVSVFHSRCACCVQAKCLFTTNPTTAHTHTRVSLWKIAIASINGFEWWCKYARDIYMHTHTQNAHSLTQKLQKQNHKTMLDMSGMDEKYRPNKRAWNEKSRKRKRKGWRIATPATTWQQFAQRIPMAIGYMQTTHINIAQQNTNWKSFLHSKTFVKIPIISTRGKWQRQSKLPDLHTHAGVAVLVLWPRRSHHRSKLVFKSM